MLTQKDLHEIELLIEEKLEEKIKHLPTKDELYEKLDGLMGELKAMREATELITGRVSVHSDQLENHEGRISKLEQSSSTL